MTMDFHKPDPDYLWDPAAPANPEVARIERIFAPLRFSPAAVPLSLEPRTAPGATRRWLRRTVIGTAAALLLVTIAAVYRWTWPDGMAWTMTLVSNETKRQTQLAVGQPLELGPTDMARIQVARIGLMEASGGTEITLRSTTSNRHSLELTEGSVRVRLWAPPRALLIRTPAGDIADLGCRFRLQVDPDGRALVSVDSGWVQLENPYGESLVPAGASSEMGPRTPPLTPVFADASESFRRGARALEPAIASGAVSPRSLDFVREARPRDVITLLMLARNAVPEIRRALLARAADLAPPPSGVNIETLLGGDMEPLWRWNDALGLPPPKSWWRNWRDAFASR
jgi:hypothetical protein